MAPVVTIPFPDQQKQPLRVGFTLIAGVVALACLATPWPAAAFIFATWLPLVTLLVRLPKVQWEADDMGLTATGYFYRWRIPRESIESVVAQSHKNSILVGGSGGTGVAMPIGTSQATEVSRARGRRYAAELAELWSITPEESRESGLRDLGSVRLRPLGSQRSWCFTRVDALVVSLWAVPLAVSLVVKAL